MAVAMAQRAMNAFALPAASTRPPPTAHSPPRVGREQLEQVVGNHLRRLRLGYGSWQSSSSPA